MPRRIPRWLVLHRRLTFMVAFTGAVLIGYMLIVLIGRAADEKIIRAQIASCERGNLTRAELNERDAAVRRFAAEARRVAPELAGPLARLVASFGTVPLIDCERIVRND